MEFKLERKAKRIEDQLNGNDHSDNKGVFDLENDLLKDNME